MGGFKVIPLGKLLKRMGGDGDPERDWWIPFGKPIHNLYLLTTAILTHIIIIAIFISIPMWHWSIFSRQSKCCSRTFGLPVSRGIMPGVLSTKKSRITW